MDNPSNADLDMLEALLATMQQNSGGQLYEDVDDDDDDDYDDDEDDEDDDGYYEHNIQTLLNPYGGAASGGSGGSGGEGGEGGADIAGAGQMPNMQTMNFLQGLLNINNSSGLAGIEAAIGGSVGGGMGGDGAPMDAATEGFLPAMQSLVPNMNTEMVGALAGAFAGGVGAFMDHGGQGGDYPEDFDDDDDVISDEEDEEDDDDDGEDNDDDDDDDDEDNQHQFMGMPTAPRGFMAAGILAGAGGAAISAFQQNFRHQSPPAIMPPPTMSPLPSTPQIMSPLPSTPIQHSVGHLEFPSPVALPVSTNPVAVTAASTAVPVVSSSLIKMSGGSVSRADPLAALVAGIGGAALGAGLLRPIVNNLLGNSGGGTTVINKLDLSNMLPVIANDSLNSPSRTHQGADIICSLSTAFAAAKMSSSRPSNMIEPEIRLSSNIVQTDLQTADKPRTTIGKCEDDKASLGSSSGSDGSGGGKSDTESVGKKTPTPPGHERTEGSCASITDLASATESMRDSDTDNHSEVHNVTANLSDVDSEVHDQQKMPDLTHYPVGPLPVVIERPTYGWGSMLGLERAKDALKNLFHVRAFPAVFDGTEESCKGILLFGPSASGKTCLARALAKEANDSLFVGISSTFLLTHHPMDAIKLVRCMFEQARLQKPAVILFDEIEALSYHPPNCKESAIRAKDEIWAQVRGTTTLAPGYPGTDPKTLNDGLLVLGTTNKPWLLEERMRRLFAYNIHVKLPDEKARHSLFRMFLQNMPHTISEAEFNSLVSKSESYSAADINTVIRQASHIVRVENGSSPEHPLISYGDVASVLAQFRCRYNEELKQKYSSYIEAATHIEDELQESCKDRKDKPKGVKKFSQRIAKHLAAAVLAVID